MHDSHPKQLSGVVVLFTSVKHEEIHHKEKNVQPQPSSLQDRGRKRSAMQQCPTAGSNQETEALRLRNQALVMADRPI